MTLVAERWTPSGLDAADRVDAFREAISATHLPWSLDAPVDGPPGADELTRYRIGDLTLIDCRCGPCSGSRGRSQLAATSDDVVGVLFVRSGVEYVETGESRSVVRPGAALLWRGDEPVRFALPGRLHKWTLLVPAARLPYARSGPLDPAATELLASLLGTTLASAGSLSGRLGQPVADAAVDLLRGAVAPASSDDATWLRVTAFVQRHLREPSLAPSAIAAGTFVSVRSLYALFAARGTSPAAYVRSLRLEAACRDLVRRGTAVTVAEVAHGWGFRDQATFSRGFRAAFGRTPDEVRRAVPSSRPATASPPGGGDGPSP
jgi:AraC-like DNA-binding protein